MESRIFQIFFALVAAFISQISALPPISKFVKTVSFNGIKDYPQATLDELFSCYDKVNEHYEDCVKLFQCDIDSTEKTIYNKYRNDATYKKQLLSQLQLLKWIKNDVSALQAELKEKFQGLSVQDIISVIEKTGMNLHRKYTAYKGGWQHLKAGDEMKNVFKNITHTLVSKVEKRFSTFKECMDDTRWKSHES